MITEARLKQGWVSAKDMASGNTRLHLAAAERDMNIVRFLITFPETEITEINHESQTPADLAAVAEHGKIVPILTEAQQIRAEVNVQDENGNTSLHIVAKEEDWMKVRFLVNVPEIDINARINEGQASVDLAKNLDITRIIDEARHARLERCQKENSHGCSSLHAASLGENSLDTIRLLMRIPEMNIGQAPFGAIAICKWWETDKICIQAFIKRGLDIHMEFERDRMLLHYAAMCGSAEVIQTFLEQGLEVDTEYYFDKTPLHLAAEEGRTETVAELLRNDANFNARNKKGIMALHLAAEKSHTETMAKLLCNGANVNARHYGNSTPLHLTACEGRTEIATELLHNGVDVNGINKGGNTPLHLAILNNQLEMIEGLLAV
jgi:ankyrin repeat protein